jgi:hypothetical protein
MRWFLAALVIVVLFAVDRAYMDGQTAAQLTSLARSPEIDRRQLQESATANRREHQAQRL